MRTPKEIPCADGCGQIMLVFPESTLTEKACFDCGGNGTTRSCQTCDYFSDHNTHEYEEGYECSKLPSAPYLKNFPFKNGCKHYVIKSWLTMTDGDWERVANEGGAKS